MNACEYLHKEAPDGNLSTKRQT